ncbi:MAG: isochorismate synthase [Actinomycetes bacterium]
MKTVPRDARRAAEQPRLVRSQPVDLVGTLLHRLPRAADALAWVSDGSGLVGWGQAARIEVRGPDRFAIAHDWWRATVSACTVDDSVAVRGSGPVAFGSFSFTPDETSVLVVPEVILGRMGGVTWLTTVGDPPRLASPDPVRRPGGLRYAHGELPVTDFRAAVEHAVARIRAGELEKVVLAHDLLALADDDIDVRFVLAGLAAANPGCWTYAVEGLVGATPELLVSRDGDRVVSRVLAGTTARGGDELEDHERVAALLRSVKDREEHRYAVESLVDALAPHVSDLAGPVEPHALELSNVTHLATDISARLHDRSEVLDLVATLHPTAAVGGTPTPAALEVLGELEHMSRGRYAGPVGWVDARGDGEWGIALRCAQLSGRTARLFAGCGIVAASEPDAEVLEAQAKFVPVRDALEGSGPG